MKINQNLNRKQAVALGYDVNRDQTPKVIDKGQGFVAEEIIKVAKENQIPIQEDCSLVHLLQQLEINEDIPVELYEVVAEIFAFVYRLDQKK
ncbi:EscU/YscU/HrcU family type III secretion system export apparatus switch protein [Anaerobacillus sp. MEB173]|uniref:EscU/YscU/HrcU family type III secretion system export apparatus switch protein n=1 Tax=Anaerobacillus sp. MEB173 TaxID=3383345 RepID=UPI003F8F5F9A